MNDHRPREHCPICGLDFAKPREAWVRDNMSKVLMHPMCWVRVVNLRADEATCIECGKWYDGRGLMCPPCHAITKEMVTA